MLTFHISKYSPIFQQPVTPLPVKRSAAPEEFTPHLREPERRDNISARELARLQEKLENLLLVPTSRRR
jgi:hypothetical protein